MVKFTDLGLKETSYTNEENQTKKITVIPIITVKDDALEKVKGNDKKEARIWKQFNSAYGKKIEHTDDLTINHEDAKEPFKDLEDDQYFFTNLLSLTSLKENQRKNLNIGLRYLVENDEDSADVHVFSDDFISHLSEDTVAQDIDFDVLEKTYEDVVTALRNESKKNVSEIEERERIKKEQKEAEAREAERNAQVDAPESESENEDAPSQENEEVEETPQEREDTFDDEDEDDVAYEETPLTDIEELKDELFVAIDNLIPRTHLDEVNIDYDETQYESNRYGELETIALNAIAKYQNDKLALLETKRDDIVNKIYQDAVKVLWKYYLQNNKLLNYESDESEYHTEFKRIQASYQKVINGAEKRREDYHKERKEAFKERVEREAKQAYEETKARLEREEGHLPEEESYEFKDNLIANANDEYEQQLATLESDIQNVYETRKYEIVDKVVGDKDMDINRQATTIEEERKLTADEINDKHQREMRKLQQTIQSFEIEKLKKQEDFDNELSMAVNKQTSDIQKENAELKHQIELLEEKQKSAQARIKNDEETIRNKEIENDGHKKRIEMAEKEAKIYRDKYENQINSTFDAYDRNIARTRHYTDAVSESNYPTNFSHVVAPTQSGVGNTSAKGETEKVSTPHVQSDAPRMQETQNPNTYHGRDVTELIPAELQYQRDVAMGRNIAVGSVMSAFLVGSGVLGATLYHEQQNHEQQEQLQKSQDESKSQDKMDEATQLKVGDKTTIDTRQNADDEQKLKSAKVIDNSHGKVIVKTPDGKKWKLK